MKVRWLNGPLDGCEDDVERPSQLWVGPDPSDPYTKGIVYALRSDGVYRFAQGLTDELNRRLALKRN